MELFVNSSAATYLVLSKDTKVHKVHKNLRRLVFKCFLSFGSNQQCLGIIRGSILRSYSRWCFRDHMLSQSNTSWQDIRWIPTSDRWGSGREHITCYSIVLDTQIPLFKLIKKCIWGIVVITPSCAKGSFLVGDAGDHVLLLGIKLGQAKHKEMPKGWVVGFFIVCFGVIANNALGVIWALYLGITPGQAQGTIWDINQILVDRVQGKHPICCITLPHHSLLYDMIPKFVSFQFTNVKVKTPRWDYQSN